MNHRLTHLLKSTLTKPHPHHKSHHELTRTFLRSTTRPTPSPSHHIQSPRLFSSTPFARKDANFYEILDVPISISKADLKKQFYALSKSTHPDVNKDNPNAAERFAQISEAYSTLGNDEKRARYDRDVMPQFVKPSQHSQRGQSHSYAGARPATGLSKRRGQFRGPPPSFYTQGSQKESEMSAAEKAKLHAEREQAAYDRAATSGRFDPSSFTEAGQWDPLFNADPIYKTQSAEDKRRLNRRQQEVANMEAWAEDQGKFWERFVVVSLVLVLGIGLGSWVQSMMALPRGGLTDRQGRNKRVGN